jgi:hypothetical protein
MKALTLSALVLALPSIAGCNLDFNGSSHPEYALTGKSLEVPSPIAVADTLRVTFSYDVTPCVDVTRIDEVVTATRLDMDVWVRDNGTMPDSQCGAFATTVKRTVLVGPGRSPVFAVRFGTLTAESRDH